MISTTRARSFSKAKTCDIDTIDIAPAFSELFLRGFQSHDGLRTKPSAKLAREGFECSSNAGSFPLFSIVRTIALPTTTPSASAPTCRTCSACRDAESHRQRQIVTFRIRSIRRHSGFR